MEVAARNYIEIIWDRPDHPRKKARVILYLNPPVPMFSTGESFEPIPGISLVNAPYVSLGDAFERSMKAAALLLNPEAK